MANGNLTANTNDRRKFLSINPIFYVGTTVQLVIQVLILMEFYLGKAVEFN